jgi:hypothetical protein
MRYLLIICLLATSLARSYAATDQACTPVPIRKVGDDVILLVNPPPKTSLVYFFTNHSEKSMFVDHPSGRGAGAGWSSYLRPGHWSALALNKSNFTIRCSAIEPGKVISLDCSKMISVCTPKNPTISSPLKGNFWLTEDKKWEAFVKALEGRGVKFLEKPKP